MTKEFPQWATDYIAKWKDELYLYEWGIVTKLSPHPNEDTTGLTKACVSIYPNALQAEIEFRDDIPDDLSDIDEIEADDWKKTIIHELFHIRAGFVTEYIIQDVCPELGVMVGRIIETAFRGRVEPFIEIMTEVLYRLENDHRLQL